MKNIICILILLSGPVFGQSISINSGNTWTLPSPSVLVTTAGKNYEHIETSPTSQTLIRVTSLLLWSVSVQMTNTSNWDPSLKLFVRRTGDGTGSAILGGSNNYIQLTTANQAFFWGLLSLGFNRDNVPVQYKIEGLSVTLPVKTYTTTIQYTITGL
ncbi:hypothetical protein [Dyadobacter aurulentus]|uniref:hypothetical protein n=1 Tax=Dyadobacter sp. UC 10 TaxID=2605428 RepID=UPI0011F234D3|nr:hypothetical protein [Dyadobacter sp. UC 10]KAA0992840.1 hypothetical protein FXO21_23025 [Dyadobacter sp. UC 10]